MKVTARSLAGRMLAITLAAMLVCMASTAQADLATAVVANGGFEDADFPGLYGFLDVDPPGWTRISGTTLVWNNSAYTDAVAGAPGTGPALPALSGDYVGGLLTNRNNGGARTAGFYQLLGVVGAGDVGEEIRLTADFGYRSYTYSWDATMMLAFSDDPLGLTVLGDAGTLDGLTENVTVPMQQVTASFTPTADQIGMEVYALVHVEVAEGDTSFQEQHLVDNVSLSVVPEPTAFVSMLLSIGGMGLLVKRQRRPGRR